MHLGLVCFLKLQLLLTFSFLQDSVKLIFIMKFQFVRVFFFSFFFIFKILQPVSVTIELA